jgi:hypothetical protein
MGGGGWKGLRTCVESCSPGWRDSDAASEGRSPPTAVAPPQTLPVMGHQRQRSLMRPPPLQPRSLSAGRWWGWGRGGFRRCWGRGAGENREPVPSAVLRPPLHVTRRCPAAGRRWRRPTRAHNPLWRWRKRSSLASIEGEKWRRRLREDKIWGREEMRGMGVGRSGAASRVSTEKSQASHVLHGHRGVSPGEAYPPTRASSPRTYGGVPSTAAQSEWRHEIPILPS